MLSEGWLNSPILQSFLSNGQHTPRDEHLLLDVGQKLGVIFAGKIQALSMETQDFQTVQHVEQDVRLLKLGHFLNTEEVCDSVCPTCTLKTFCLCLTFISSHSEVVPAELCIWASKTQGAAGRRTLCLSYSSWLGGRGQQVSVTS